jgi:hypothetical protein
MGNGRPKQRHNAIAEDLVHRALVAVHGLHHGVQGWVKEPPGLFRIKARDQLRGALNIGKQHGDLLALALQVATRGQNFLSQMFGGVGCRGYKLGRHGGPRPDWLPAFEAEFGARRQRNVALSARQHQTAAALQAKLRLRRIVLLALRALHTGAPFRAWVT